MSADEVSIGELPNRQLGELILRALESEGIRGRIVSVAGSGGPVQLVTEPAKAELAREILAFLKAEIEKSRPR
ncbi:MAG: hypothetical protein VX574_08390 [Myxococcota bacterium]|nr:hypothetical protein [Myxococcota bacterium]